MQKDKKLLSYLKILKNFLNMKTISYYASPFLTFITLGLEYS